MSGILPVEIGRGTEDSVFEHKGGFIAAEYGKPNDIESDPPGWYYWWEAYGVSHLAGLFTTKEDAEFYCEANGL